MFPLRTFDFHPVPWGLCKTTVHVNRLKSTLHPPLGLTPLQSLPSWFRRLNSEEFSLTLLRSRSLKRRKIKKSTYRKPCLTHYVPPSGFLNLLTAYSSLLRVALFHATSTTGIHPSKLFPFVKLFDALASTLPSWRYFDSTNIPKNIDLAKIRLQGFIPYESPLPPNGLLHHLNARCFLGVSPL
jgi:hypothetical protein